MRSFKWLSTMGAFALCLSAHSPALSQDSIPIFPLIDFEAMVIRSNLGPIGYPYADNGEVNNDSVTFGNSMLTTFEYHEDPDSMKWVPGRMGDSTTKAYKMGYRLGTVRLGCGLNCTYPPHVGVAVSFSETYDPLDLTGATHVTFWAKGDDSLTLNVSIGMRDTTPRPAGYSQVFVIDTTWKKYSIQLAASTDFKLPDWVTSFPFEAARANGIGFSINKDANPVHADNALYLDDIEIVNWVYTPYMEPVGISSQSDKTQRADGLRARISGNQALVRLPAAFLGKSGVVEALDATGRKVGRAAFGPQALDVSMAILGASAKSAGLYIRVLSK